MPAIYTDGFKNTGVLSNEDGDGNRRLSGKIQI